MEAQDLSFSANSLLKAAAGKECLRKQLGQTSFHPWREDTCSGRSQRSWLEIEMD